ncbi:MAG: tetratricopeptide repeat protein [Candidatus Rokubacteria bacterium]|nr:tetratricopeptide repeat protein [Candidatus Rokubacteria bacterium]
MRLGSALVVVAFVPVLAAACATAYTDGRSALQEGRYIDAAERFEQAVASEPQNVDALVGLGLARYKLADFEEAAATLDRAVARAPRHVVARLYLGLAHLQRAEDGPAEEHLGEVARIAAGTRTAAQIDRALRVLRGRDPLSEDMRQFIAAAIEDDAELERQVRETAAALRDAEMRRQPAVTIPIGGRRSRSPLELIFR